MCLCIFPCFCKRGNRAIVYCLKCPAFALADQEKVRAGKGRAYPARLGWDIGEHFR